MTYICSCFFWFTETYKKNWWKITCHADILVELHTCRRARHKSPICSDIHRVDGSNLEEGHTPSDRLAHRTNHQSILSEKKHRLYKEKCLHLWFFIALFLTTSAMNSITLCFFFYLASTLLLRLRHKRSASLDVERQVSHRLASSIWERI